MDKDYYKILGVNESDSAEQIKSAYRKLARKWHPDVAGNTSDVLLRFKEINEAYEILSDKQKKSEYDKARSFYNYAKYGAGESVNKSAKQNNTEEKTYSSNPYTKKFSINWEEFLHGRRGESSHGETKNKETKVPQNGEDIYAEIELSVLEAIQGAEKVINVLQTDTCPVCSGRKFVNGSLCGHCGGSGKTSKHKKFTVKIPAGIKNGAKIRLHGEGGTGLNGGRNGDLYVTVNIKADCDYKTEGLNIIKTVSIAPYEAVLGAEIEVSTINGKYSFKIAPNTQNGQKIRLSGCGIVQNEKVGDMIIVVEIKIPKTVSKEEIELYKKLAEISSQNIRDSIYD